MTTDNAMAQAEEPAACLSLFIGCSERRIMSVWISLTNDFLFSGNWQGTWASFPIGKVGNCP